MKLDQQVASLELCKRLDKEFGLHANRSEFQWCVDPVDRVPPHVCPDWLEQEPGTKTYPAFSVAELGEMLPKQYYSYRYPIYSDGVLQGFEWECHNEITPGQKADTEADARAKMLIYLLENKLITL